MFNKCKIVTLFMENNTKLVHNDTYMQFRFNCLSYRSDFKNGHTNMQVLPLKNEKKSINKQSKEHQKNRTNSKTKIIKCYV